MIPALVLAAFNFLSAWNNIWPILVAILVFVIIILIHELGHFLFAKLLGVQVNEFAVGFGPTLLQFQKGETKYAIRALPLGGFCAMEGEDEESDNPRAFNRKKVWRRFLIVVAGAAFNVILGFVLMTIILIPQKSFQTTTVSGFASNASSQASGLAEDDKIVKINGRSVFAVSDISYILRTDKDGVFDFVVKRNGKKVKLPDVTFAMKKAEGEAQEIVIDFGVREVQNSVGQTLSQGFLRTLSMGRIIWMSLIDLITGKYGLSGIAGPVGTVQAIGQAASTNIWELLMIMCLITVNLGIFNLLPIPGLDGGRLLFLIVEGIRRKPIAPKYEGYIHAAGLILLFGLVIIVTFNDIVRIVSGG